MTDFVYECKHCGAKYDEIPQAYKGFSGDHFGGGRTMWPCCRDCGNGTFRTMIKPEVEAPMGEEEKIKQVIRIAKEIGFGNLISHLKSSWALMLTKNSYSVSYERSLKATEVSALPKSAAFDPDQI